MCVCMCLCLWACVCVCLHVCEETLVGFKSQPHWMLTLIWSFYWYEFKVRGAKVKVEDTRSLSVVDTCGISTTTFFCYWIKFNSGFLFEGLKTLFLQKVPWFFFFIVSCRTQKPVWRMLHMQSKTVTTCGKNAVLLNCLHSNKMILPNAKTQT